MEPCWIDVEVKKRIATGIVLAWKVALTAACRILFHLSRSYEQQARLDASAEWVEKEYLSCGSCLWL